MMNVNKHLFGFLIILLILFNTASVFGDIEHSEYLVLTRECESTPELEALAMELNHDPVKIFYWVKNNIANQTYFYSRKSAQATYDTMAGNSYDQASLLITLLRISDIPARYVQLTHRASDTKYYVYVEAWVPSEQYRGAGPGLRKEWTPLVPWSKNLNIEKGINLFPNGIIPQDLNFDFDAYLAQTNQNTALELFEKDMQDYLAVQHPGKTIDDIPYRKKIKQKTASILPDSLPRNIASSYTPTSGAVWAEIPNQFRGNITLYIKRASGGTPILEKIVYLSEIAGKRFCLDFETIDSTTLKPVLKIDGIEITDGSVIYGSNRYLSTTEEYYPAFEGGGFEGSDFKYQERPSKKAGTFMQIAFDALSASHKAIEKNKAELVEMTADANSEAYLGRIGAILINTFLERQYRAMSRAADLLYLKKSWGGAFPTFIYTLPEDVPTADQSKFYIHPQWNIDAQIGLNFSYVADGSSVISLDRNDPLETLYRRLNMFSGSFNEGRIFEDWQDTPAISTVQGLMIANEDPNNWVATLPMPNLISDLQLNPSDPFEQDALDTITRELQQGNSIITPVKMLVFDDKPAFVYLSEGTDHIGFMFNMDYGGAGSSQPAPDTSKEDDVTGGQAQQNQDVRDSTEKIISIDNVDGTTHAENAGSWFSKVISALSPIADPVNMTTGEFYQEEEPDFNIPSKGFNLSIARTYKSRVIYNGPFGFGWTWNHGEFIVPLQDQSLVYYDKSALPNKLIYDAEEDTYILPPGSTYKVEKQDDQYFITFRDKTRFTFDVNGLLKEKRDAFDNILTIEHTDSSDPVRVTAIKDSFERTLTFTYNPNGKIRKVTDFAGNYCTYDYNGDDLTSFTDLASNTTRFQYLTEQENPLNNHNMSRYIMPPKDGAPEGDYLEIGYYKNDQAAFHRNRKGETFNFQYSRLNGYGETWDENGYYRKVYFNDTLDEIRVDNEDGTLSRKDYDDFHNVTSFTDGNGNVTTFNYGSTPEEQALRLLRSKTNESLDLTWTYEYNSTENPFAPSKVIDPNGNSVEFEYYTNHKLHTKTVAKGYDYNTDGRLEVSSGSPGFTTTYAYDQHGNLQLVTDPLNNIVTNTYDSSGLHLITATDKNSHRTTFAYYGLNNSDAMPVGLLKSKTIEAPPEELENYTTSFQYNKYNQITNTVDALGSNTAFQYDENRKLKRATYPDNTFIENFYDDPARDIVSGAQITRTMDQLGNITHFGYDSAGNKIWEQDKNGNITDFYYDGMKRLVEEIDPLGSSSHLFYDGNGNLVKKTDKRDFDNSVTYTYDAANRLLSVTDVEQKTTKFKYTPTGKIDEKTDPNNIITKYEYDVLDRLITKTVNFNGDVTRIYQYRYDPFNRLVKEIFPLENYKTIFYDPQGNKEMVVSYDRDDNELQTTEYRYYPDSRNLVKEIIVDGGKNNSDTGRKFEYDALGRKTADIDPLGNRVEYEYDWAGRLITIINPIGVTRHYYDLAGQRIKTVNAVGGEIVYQYDPNGNMTAARDEAGNKSTFWYDALNRKIASQDHLGGLTIFDYDANGNLVKTVDANGNANSFVYDGNNRKVKETRPMGEQTHYWYDDAGNLSYIINGKGHKITYDYTPFNQIDISDYFSAEDDVTPVRVVDFTYDLNGNLQQYVDTDTGTGTTTSTTYAYDDLNRKTGETVNFDTFPKNFTYSYPDSWTRKFTGPDGVPVTYKYDANGRLQTVAVPNQTLISYDEYNWNSPAQVSMSGGTTVGYEYDFMMRVKSITAEDILQDSLSREYDYSATGNITAKRTEHGDYVYTYDPVHRLLTADNPDVVGLVDETYTYDDVGNRTSNALMPGPWVYNSNNELTGIDTSSYAYGYDANGSMASRTEAGLTTYFGYNSENRLEVVKGDTGNVIAEYKYDPFGRRIAKTVAGDTTYYLYSDEGLIGEYNANGDEIRSYGFAPGSQWGTNPLYINVDEAYHFYLNDHLGTPQKIVNDTGAVVWSAIYDSFGNAEILIDDSNGGIVNNLRFAGQYYDDETGLHYNWNRYYDPEIGRYLRTDPLGLSAGINLYAYVNNNPLRFVDPEGLIARDTWNATVNLNNTFNQVVLSPFVAASTAVDWVDNKIYDYAGISPDDQIGMLMAAGGPVAGEGFSAVKNSLKAVKNFVSASHRALKPATRLSNVTKYHDWTTFREDFSQVPRSYARSLWNEHNNNPDKFISRNIVQAKLADQGLIKRSLPEKVSILHEQSSGGEVGAQVVQFSTEFVAQKVTPPSVEPLLYNTKAGIVGKVFGALFP